ncbi:hypothetical protein AVEN_153809-1 [Araneus ventricosus]|uniref:Uncharacterized protein n=1 Tax=Araneus ventricosus TaxID=182803 RepID=A0A4Y2U2L2_ARAVE|nr:hypothetical protein AVEN_153809-1 [Araneus ventricosus]
MESDSNRVSNQRPSVLEDKTPPAGHRGRKEVQVRLKYERVFSFKDPNPKKNLWHLLDVNDPHSPDPNPKKNLWHLLDVNDPHSPDPNPKKNLWHLLDVNDPHSPDPNPKKNLWHLLDMQEEEFFLTYQKQTIREG